MLANTGEEPSEYASCHTGAVATYVNQTNLLNQVKERQFVVLLLRDANLPPDTLNALMYQFNMREAAAADCSLEAMPQYTVNISERTPMKSRVWVHWIRQTKRS